MRAPVRIQEDPKSKEFPPQRASWSVGAAVWRGRCDAEVPAIERGDLRGSQSFGDGDDRGIDHAQGKVRIG